MASYVGVNAEVARRGQAVAQAFRQQTGYSLVLTSGKRDSAQQEELYERWRQKVPGALPANPPGQSSHEWGLGLDYAVQGVAFNSALGKKLYPIYWRIARQAGFHTLGARDPVHCEVPGWKGIVQRYTAQLQQQMQRLRAKDPGGNLKL